MVDQLSFSKRFRAEDTHLWCFVLKYIPSPHLRGHLDSICLSLQMDDECSRWVRWKGIPVLSCRHYVAQWSLIFCCCTRHLILIGRLLCVSSYSIRGQEINDWKKTMTSSPGRERWVTKPGKCVTLFVWTCEGVMWWMQTFSLLSPLVMMDWLNWSFQFCAQNTSVAQREELALWFAVFGYRHKRH